MFKLISKIAIAVILLIALQSCSNPVGEISIKISEASKEAFKEMAAFSQTLKEAKKTLAEHTDYQDIHIEAGGEFDAENEIINVVSLTIQYDKTESSSEADLMARGKEAMQVVTNVIQSEKGYDKYEVKFLQDAMEETDTDEEKDAKARIFTYTKLDISN